MVSRSPVRSQSNTSLRCSIGIIVIDCKSCASCAFAVGTTAVRIPALKAAIKEGSTPRTGRMCPSNESSPKKTIFSIRSTGIVS
ncbi:unannotated protein [freshwater metagenome]|uniref:Unannotated protein n=1 Tax=freshwater metagenome TaxID=449393 RepID=A0A6J6E238_9ZZZZ